MSGLKRDIPVPIASPEAYKILLRRERMQKPASVVFRKEMLERNRRANYINEYDRILGLLTGQADRFSIPGGHFAKDKLTNRLQMSKKLFRESHEGEKHLTMKK